MFSCSITSSTTLEKSLRENICLLIVLQPDRQDELMRIEREGGKVINWMGARVLGVLAMSRAIGFNLSLSPFLFLSLSCLCLSDCYLNFDSLLIRTVREIHVSHDYSTVSVAMLAWLTYRRVSLERCSQLFLFLL